MKNVITKSDFDISVIILAYNSERYIAQCLQSVFNQRFSGIIEICVWDDASIDQTENVVKRFCSQSENRKQLVYNKHEINKGAWQNFVHAQQRTRGKYVAYLEADDYWIDYNKLQYQFDYLEENEEAWGIASRCQFVDMDGNPIPNAYFNSDKEQRIVLKDCWYYPTFQASSLLFRNTIDFNHYKLDNSNILNDKRIYLLGCRQGYIYYKAINTSAYRVHSSNLTSTTTDMYVLFQHLSCNLLFLRLFGPSQFNLFIKGCTRMIYGYLTKRITNTFRSFMLFW